MPTVNLAYATINDKLYMIGGITETNDSLTFETKKRRMQFLGTGITAFDLQTTETDTTTTDESLTANFESQSYSSVSNNLLIIGSLIKFDPNTYDFIFLNPAPINISQPCVVSDDNNQYLYVIGGINNNNNITSFVFLQTLIFLFFIFYFLFFIFV